MRCRSVAIPGVTYGHGLRAPDRIDAGAGHRRHVDELTVLWSVVCLDPLPADGVTRL